MSKAVVLSSDGSFFVGREHFAKPVNKPAAKQTYSGVLGDDRCECFDSGCLHQRASVLTGAKPRQCSDKASTTLYRIDMEDNTGTRFCSPCAEDAMESGLFTDETDEDEDADENELDADGEEFAESFYLNLHKVDPSNQI